MEAVRLLPPGALAYARLDPATVGAVLSSLPGEARAAAGELADRTDAMTAALVYDGARRKTSLLAVAEGRYPAGAITLRLSGDKAWRRDGPVISRADGSVYLAFAEGGRAFAGTAPLDPILAAAASPGSSPIPARWRSAWDEPVVIYLPEPISFIARRLPLGDGAVPMRSLLLWARPAAGGGYEATLAFEFDRDRSATVYGPLCRVFLYAAANYLWPERSATVLDAARWSTEGAVVTVSGLPLDAESIVAFLGVPSP